MPGRRKSVETGMIKNKVWITAAAALFAGLAACSPISNSHGYVPMEDELALLETGVATKSQVAEAIGLPATSNRRYGDDWFYVSSQFQQRGFMAPEETERQVVVVSFDNSGTLSNVAKYSLRDGRAVALSRRVTETNLGRLNFIQQMLRSLGRIDPGSVFSQE